MTTSEHNSGVIENEARTRFRAVCSCGWGTRTGKHEAHAWDAVRLHERDVENSRPTNREQLQYRVELARARKA